MLCCAALGCSNYKNGCQKKTYILFTTDDRSVEKKREKRKHAMAVLHLRKAAVSRERCVSLDMNISAE